MRHIRHVSTSLLRHFRVNKHDTTQHFHLQRFQLLLRHSNNSGEEGKKNLKILQGGQGGIYIAIYSEGKTTCQQKDGQPVRNSDRATGIKNMVHLN